ncbi:MAG: hypothetical protein GY856_34200, partial [bacterium]|nr:hypothetical protein [bacterium]
TGVKYVVLVGDDRIIPLARLQDRTVLLLEENYPAGGGLTSDGTTVGQALAANKYLSDDPLAVLDPVRPDELSGNLYIPDLALGRLVETPEEIITTIATFISQDGVLDLTTLDPVTGHKVLVTGYDFLLDSGKKIRKRWKSALRQTDDSLAPVDGRLLSANWGEGSVASRRAALRNHLSGHGGDRYAISILTGHATHYQEGVPGTDSFDIRGLNVEELYGAEPAVDLAGGVVFALGCHGGLPVAGSDAGGGDRSLDLPQTMLSLGVLSYVANTGYGWGLKHGVGYGERLFEILTEEMTRGGTVVTGDAVKRTKQRYLLETPRFDPYDEKSLMQWSFFGLPMVAVRTGIGPGPAGARTEAAGPFEGPPPQVGTRPAVERFGPVSVARRLSEGEPGDSSTHRRARPRASLPRYLTRLDLQFDLTADGVYTKRNALGDELPDTPGCPQPRPGEPEGCYYTLNGLVERGTGETDLPIQPYFIYDSRFSGTSQHGVLWKGGVYEQENGWVPVIAELMSNGGNGTNRGAT